MVADIDDLVIKAFTELQVESTEEFYIFLSKHVIPDILEILQLRGKAAFRKYAAVLQKAYAQNSCLTFYQICGAKAVNKRRCKTVSVRT